MKKSYIVLFLLFADSLFATTYNFDASFNCSDWDFTPPAQCSVTYSDLTITTNDASGQIASLGTYTSDNVSLDDDGQAGSDRYLSWGGAGVGSSGSVRYAEFKYTDGKTFDAATIDIGIWTYHTNEGQPPDSDTLTITGYNSADIEVGKIVFSPVYRDDTILSLNFSNPSMTDYQNNNGFYSNQALTTNTGSFSGISKLRFTINSNTVYLDNLTLIPASSSDATSTLTSSATLSEPNSISTTAINTTNDVSLLDFTITDPVAGDDGNPTIVSTLTVDVTGTSTDTERGLMKFVLNGPDVTDAIGTYDSGTDKITFDLSSTNISITDDSNETYTISAYFSDNTSNNDIIEGHTIILAVNASDLTTTGTTSTFASSQSDVTNGSGVAIDVIATKLNFTTQPAGSVSGSALTTQPVVKAVDARGNVDTDYTSTITLSEASAGTLSGDIDITAVSGVSTFTDVVYTASADQESFTLTASDSSLTDATANSVTSDVVATKLIFTTQPAPTTIEKNVLKDFTTDPVVKAVDANNTVDTSFTELVTLSENGSGGASFTNNTATAVAGVATFNSTTITYDSSGTFNITANDVDGTGSNLSIATSTNITSSDTTAPIVSSVSVPSNGTYITGDNLSFTVNTNEIVTISGTPYIALTIGSITKYATYISGSGTSALLFRYTLESGLSDNNGISVGTLNLNGGTIKDSAGNNMTTTLNSVGSTNSVLIDSIIPSITNVTSTAANGSYKVGDTIAVTIIFNESVTVTGTPQLKLETGTTDRTINYTSGNGTNTLTFNYTVQNGDTTNELDYTSTSSLLLNGGTIKDSAGNNAILTLASPGTVNSLGANKDIVIDTTAPTISSLNPNDGATDIGTTANLVATFNENISKGTGNIVIKKTSDNTVFETIPVTDSKVTISSSTITINPAGTFDLNTGYYVQIASGAIIDSSGNSFIGITNNSDWNFTTVNNLTPTISGTVSNQAINDDSGAMSPFSGVTLTDTENDNISITLSLDDNDKGTLSSTSIASGSVASVQAALRAITFTPAENRVEPGSTETTTITITVADDYSNTTDSNTTIVSTSINDIPTNISLSSSSVKYDDGTNATVGTLSTTDADVTTNFAYSLVNIGTSGSGTCTSDTNNDLFSISGSDLLVLDPSSMDGNYNVCVQSNDGTTTFQKSLTINVVGNNEPVIDSLSISNQNDTAVDNNSNIIVYKNYGSRTITINATDADSDPLTYSVSFSDDSIFTTKSLASNILTLASDADTSGDSDITITVDDGVDTTTKTFNFKILTFNDGDNVNESGSVSVTTNADGDEVTTVDVPADNLVVKKIVKNDGSTEQSIIINGVESKVVSGSPSSVIEITEDGVTTTFTNNGIDAKADTTVLGKTTHRLTKNGQTTKAVSNVLGSNTTISEDGDGNPQIVTTVGNIEVDAKPDGSAVHIVTNGSTSSKTTSSILGADTIINNDNVQTLAGKLTSGSFTIKAKSVTKDDGTTVTRFVSVDGSNNETVLGDTLNDGSVFANGNTVEIYEDNGAIFIKITAPLSDDLVVE
ncbi:Ig-like domain-containing protein [Halarcobacter sp.]|uniref:beta strand repeat-containing protein n=1 Tax=Halarcobacter sp. TaxID=2321133 RepID=UPI002AAB345F|nr:Ig-like domain-containing protein [Halarcobacter sp.]